MNYVYNDFKNNWEKKSKNGKWIEVTRSDIHDSIERTAKRKKTNYQNKSFI